MARTPVKLNSGEVAIAGEVWAKTGHENLRSFVESSRTNLRAQRQVAKALKVASSEFLARLARAQRRLASIPGADNQNRHHLLHVIAVAERQTEAVRDAFYEHLEISVARAEDLEGQLAPELPRRGRGAISRQALFVRKLLVRLPSFGTSVEKWLALDAKIFFLENQQSREGNARRRAMKKLLQRAPLVRPRI